MKKLLIAAAIVAGLAAALAAGGVWYLFHDDPAEADNDKELTRTLLVAAVKGATLGPWYLHKAAAMTPDRLLADIIAMKGNAAPPTSAETVYPPDLTGDSRAKHALPDELTAILRTPGAIQALQWKASADIASLRELHGKNMPGKFRMDDRQWQGGSVRVESHGGAVHRIPTQALEGYLVLAEDRLLSDAMVLYDPSQTPAYPCCRVIETSPFKSQNHDGHRSLEDYLRWEWAMAKAR